MAGTYHDFERGASRTRDQQKKVWLQDQESPGGKHGHLEKKKMEICSWCLFQGLDIGRQEISRASAPVQPLGFSLGNL